MSVRYYGSRKETFGFRTGLEFSDQRVPIESVDTYNLAPSRPLHELAYEAPAVSTHGSWRDARYPFSNDGNACDYEALRARILTPEYQSATNRVAVLCGESALGTSIADMHEDTIILVDIDPSMCQFMQRYVDALRGSDTPAEMLERMGLSWNDDGFGEIALTRLESQIFEWEDRRGYHAMSDVAYFRRASELARAKAIIIWHADLTNPEDMRNLGNELRKLEASITLVNITNVPAVYAGGAEDALTTSRLGHSLSQLPLTLNAPIMTSSTTRKSQQDCIVEPLGPFFGLGNLMTSGGEISWSNPGAIIERQYCEDVVGAEPGVEATTIVIGQVVIKFC